MSELRRVISSTLYELERKKQRKSSSHRYMNKGGNKPQIIGFRVGSDEDKSFKEQTIRTRGRRQKRNNDYAIKKAIGLVLIVVGTILLLGKCFGGGKEAVPKEQLKQSQDTQAYGSYVQDFPIDAKTLHQLIKYSHQYNLSYAQTLGVWAYESYQGKSQYKIKQILRQKQRKLTLPNDEFYNSAASIYDQFINDLEVFPVSNKKDYTYENTWKAKRSYKEDRLHYGVDLMAKVNVAGEIAIHSITDGIVEKVGWNELGGYRVGIRSPGGAYFYYAHLHEQPDFLQEGDSVYAGQIIGKMGHTGYGEEGTYGKFPVHLHLGIAVKGKEDKSYWINPYPVVRYLEKYKS